MRANPFLLKLIAAFSGLTKAVAAPGGFTHCSVYWALCSVNGNSIPFWGSMEISAIEYATVHQ